MKTLIFNSILMIVILALSSCNAEDAESTTTQSPEWLIPQSEVRDGGPGKDGIPALENPEFTEPDNIDYLDDNSLIIGYASDGNAWAYPHNILDWHEIINDDVAGVAFAITYCPLTGTGTAWNRVVNGRKTTFGVSGLLYNSNLIPYDRETNSNWSQIRLDCVNGENIETKVETFQIVETTWKTWNDMYPQTKVVSENTGHSRNYEKYPYGDYKTNHSKLIFPVSNTDSRLPNKERVHGIIVDGKAKAYSINSFGDDISVIVDEIQSTKVIVAGRKAENLIVSFQSSLSDGTALTFLPVQDALPVIMEDAEGSQWDIFGNAVNGPHMGERLIPTTSFMGYWFAWAAFYPDLELY